MVEEQFYQIRTNEWMGNSDLQSDEATEEICCTRAASVLKVEMRWRKHSLKK